MFTLGSKSLVINDAALVDITGTVMSIPGFGSIDNTDPAYTKVVTTGIATTLSSVDLATVAQGDEVAIYWQNRRYIGEGVSNMSSSPQAPLVIAFPSTVANIAAAWALHEEAFGDSELFWLDGTILKSKNAAVDVIRAETRTLIDPTVDVNTFQTGFRYGRFGGVAYGGAIISLIDGVCTGKQVEESVRHSIGSNVDPYSDKPHGSEEVELDALYNIYDFTVQLMGPVDGYDIHEHLAQTTPDESIINDPIKFRIYAKQGDASVPIAAF